MFAIGHSSICFWKWLQVYSIAWSFSIPSSPTIPLPFLLLLISFLPSQVCFFASFIFSYNLCFRFLIVEKQNIMRYFTFCTSLTLHGGFKFHLFSCSWHDFILLYSWMLVIYIYIYMTNGYIFVYWWASIMFPEFSCYELHCCKCEDACITIVSYVSFFQE